MFAAASLLLGCASIRHIQLVNRSSLEATEGSFDPGTGLIRIYLPDGTLLTGTVRETSSSGINIPPYIPNPVDIIGTVAERAINPPPREGYALLESPDGTLHMEMNITYSRDAGSGTGEAKASDGRVYTVRF